MFTIRIRLTVLDNHRIDESDYLHGCISVWCAVYIRHEYESHEVSCRLVTSKSKVAPLTPMTVPKLELMGAVLGLRLAQSVIVVLGITNARCVILLE